MPNSFRKTGPRKGATQGSNLPPPFKRAPESLAPFYETLSEKHIYIAHIDSKPRGFKQRIFAVPTLMNVAVVLLFVLRIWYIGPFYLYLLSNTLGYSDDPSYILASDLSWGQLSFAIFRRALTFMLDLTLVVFVWPWPLEFAFGRRHGNPVNWRWRVGFRDREIYVRRSREWDRGLMGDRDIFAAGRDAERAGQLRQLQAATAPMYLQEKTGYLTINGEWDLDWAAMVHATHLVDKKDLALDAFRSLILLFHKEHGWMSVDLKMGENAQEDDRRRQVFAFRDALTAVGKEDLFFRWIEMIQFESSQPAGFGVEKQAEVATKVREMFQSNGIDFDEFWKESVGSEGLSGM